MTYATHATPSAFVEYVAEPPSNTVRGRVQQKLREEVLPHYFAPASRQRALESLAEMPTMIADADAELESPSFTPVELSAFAARGFARRNRWGSKGG
jgi:hypothetical protein